MSYLEKILDGASVEWKPLGEISELYSGLSGKSKKDFEDGNAQYISFKKIYNNIEINFTIDDRVKVSSNENQNTLMYGDVIFTGSSETPNDVGMSSSVTTKLEQNIYLNSFCFGLRFNDDILIIPEFSKYLFRSDFMRKSIAKTASGVTRYNISKTKFKKIKFPIPYPNNPKKSLEIQQKIVAILDSFTKYTADLTTDLKADLTSRKKQYCYYREKLLSFETNEVEWKTLGEIGELIRGNGLPKSDFTEMGVPAIHYGQIYTYYGTYAERTISFVSEETANKLRKVNYGDVILTNTSENIEDVGKALVYLGDEQAVTGGHATIFKPSNKISGKYFAYYTQTEGFAIQKRKFARGTKVIDVSASDMSKILIPLPRIEEQHHIVSILDRFEVLNNSISESLCKEIELRKKQYEYYRDLLLTFPQDNLAE